MRAWLIILLCVLTAFTIGCAKVPALLNNEPTMIIVRNSSNFYLKEVSLRGMDKINNRYVRVGAISPVPNGFSQVIGRPTNPPKMPRKINVCWIDNANKEFCKQVDLKNVLKGSKDYGNALVFEILDFSMVNVYLEKNH